MDDILELAAGYPLMGVAVVLLWRLMREYRRQMEFWRDKYIAMREVADTSTHAAEVLVRPTETEQEARRKFGEVVDLVLKREREDAS